MTFEDHWKTLPYWIRRMVRIEDQYGEEYPDEPVKDVDTLWNDVLHQLYRAIAGDDEYDGMKDLLETMGELLTDRTELESIIYSTTELDNIKEMLQDALQENVTKITEEGSEFIETLTGLQDPGRWHFSYFGVFDSAIRFCKDDLHRLRAKWRG